MSKLNTRKMQHISSIFIFEDNGHTWRVEYKPEGNGMIYWNDRKYGSFKAHEGTKTVNPTKTKSLELIRIVKKRELAKQGKANTGLKQPKGVIDYKIGEDLLKSMHEEKPGPPTSSAELSDKSGSHISIDSELQNFIDNCPGDSVVVQDPNGDYDYRDLEDKDDYDVVYDPTEKKGLMKTVCDEWSDLQKKKVRGLLIEWLQTDGYTFNEAEDQIDEATIERHGNLYSITYDNKANDIVRIKGSKVTVASRPDWFKESGPQRGNINGSEDE